jgi:hypothetical protein
MNIYVDIDETICFYENRDYVNPDYSEAIPHYGNIEKINNLYDEGHTIKYWTARGGTTGIDWFEVTQNQLQQWGCKYHDLSVGDKPPYDLLICDKTKRIEEI